MINIDKEQIGDILTIKVIGDVDASSSIVLDEAIKGAVEGGSKKLMVNGQELQYISSAGLGVFMSYIQDFEKEGIKMALYGLNEKVINVFKILGLDQLLSMVDTEEEAKSLLNA